MRACGGVRWWCASATWLACRGASQQPAAALQPCLEQLCGALDSSQAGPCVMHTGDSRLRGAAVRYLVALARAGGGEGGQEEEPLEEEQRPAQAIAGGLWAQHPELLCR